jgi:hypothetical protein
MAVTRRRAPAIARDYALALRWRAAAMRGGAAPAAWAIGTGNPVVLVPGVWEPWQFLSRIGERLHEAGHPVHVVPEVRRNNAPIPDVAAIVHAALERLDLHAVRIVAHSKGGLIGKHLIADPATGSRIDRVVAIATPFGGSVRANATLFPALREFRPSHPTMRALHAATEANARITSIYGAYDFHVPAGSALAGAVNVEVPYIGHFGVLTDERVIAEVLRAVAS